MLTSALRQWRQSKRSLRHGQTMAEYAIVVAAIAIVVFVTYEALGQNIDALTSWKVDAYLTSAS